jgi:membrane protease YdiL (CAAX protease family)
VAATLVAGAGLSSRSVGEVSPLLELDAALPWIAGLVGTELLFRGLAYGQLVWAFGPHAPSPAGSAASSEGVDRASPVVLTALLSSVAGWILAGPGAPLVPLPESLAQMPLVLAGSLVVGMAAGFARQRSESVLAAIAVYAIVAAVAVLPSVGGLA